MLFRSDDLKETQEWNFEKPGNGEGEVRRPGGSVNRGEIREKKARLSMKEKRERVRKRVEVMRMLRLTQELNLDEETAARFFARIRPIDQKRWELMKKKQELQRSMKKAGASDLTHQREIRSLVKALKENRAAFEKLDDEEMEAVRELMTPPQQAKYIVFKERFSEEKIGRAHV